MSRCGRCGTDLLSTGDGDGDGLCGICRWAPQPTYHEPTKEDMVADIARLEAKVNALTYKIDKLMMAITAWENEEITAWENSKELSVKSENLKALIAAAKDLSPQ